MSIPESDPSDEISEEEYHRQLAEYLQREDEFVTKFVDADHQMVETKEVTLQIDLALIGHPLVQVAMVVAKKEPWIAPQWEPYAKCADEEKEMFVHWINMIGAKALVPKSLGAVAVSFEKCDLARQFLCYTPENGDDREFLSKALGVDNEEDVWIRIGLKVKGWRACRFLTFLTPTAAFAKVSAFIKTLLSGSAKTQ